MGGKALVREAGAQGELGDAEGVVAARMVGMVRK